jgi:hypothetical protein
VLSRRHADHRESVSGEVNRRFHHGWLAVSSAA